MQCLHKILFTTFFVKKLVNKSQQESERVKSTIYRKNEDKTNYLLKSKVNYEEKDVEPISVKTKNNFLNLSILKHIWYDDYLH